MLNTTDATFKETGVLQFNDYFVEQWLENDVIGTLCISGKDQIQYIRNAVCSKQDTKHYIIIKKTGRFPPEERSNWRRAYQRKEGGSEILRNWLRLAKPRKLCSPKTISSRKKSSSIFGTIIPDNHNTTIQSSLLFSDSRSNTARQ